MLCWILIYCMISLSANSGQAATFEQQAIATELAPEWATGYSSYVGD